MKQSAIELREELNRVNSENKKLTEMLATVCENYYALHHHLEKLQGRKSPEIDQTEQPTKKRKQDPDELLGFPIGRGSGKTENSSSNEDHHHQPQHEQKNQILSCKRPVTDSFNKAKVSTVYVPADASDTSLVSVCCLNLLIKRHVLVEICLNIAKASIWVLLCMFV